MHDMGTMSLSKKHHNLRGGNRDDNVVGETASEQWRCDGAERCQSCGTAREDDGSGLENKRP